MSNQPPLRRSTRAASLGPTGTAPARAAPLPTTNGTSKPAPAKPTKPVAQTGTRSSKRVSSPVRDSPPRKRARSRGVQSDTEDSKAATLKRTMSSRKLGRKPTLNGLPTVTEERQQLKPYFNSLPTPAAHPRPPNQLFVWGAGNFGQFGMGPDCLGEYSAPKRNTWVDAKIKEGVFGSEGAGLEAVAAGGLHTLFLDEKGTVRHSMLCYNSYSHFLSRSGHVESTMTPRWVVSRKMSLTPTTQAPSLTSTLSLLTLIRYSP